MNAPVHLTDPAAFFLEPTHPRHRQYEALHAYFVDKLPSEQVAYHFGYTLTLIASSLYRLLGSQLHGFGHAKALSVNPRDNRSRAPGNTPVKAYFPVKIEA